MAEIVIENLYKSFDTKDGTVEALKNVNLSIESGDIYGIIGMSGAGKSTLVRCINFLEVPTKGRNDFSAFQLTDAEKCFGKCLFSVVYSGKVQERCQKACKGAFRYRWTWR